MTTELHDELTTLTCDLMRFPSTAERPEQLAAALDYVAAYLETIADIHVQRSSDADKPAIVVTLHETRHPAVMLNGHLDVVAAKPHQFEPEVRDGRIYGRASQDMKGSTAVMLRLIKDLAALEQRPDVGFQFVSDEEIGGMHGTNRLLTEGWECDTFLALEPTDLNICNAHKGAMWVELRLPGQPGHGSRPWDSHNPVRDLAAGLAAIEQRFPTPAQEAWRTTVTPTVVNTGSGSRNQIPPSVTLTLDIRFVPEDTPEMIRAALAEAFPTAEITIDECGAGLDTAADTPALQRLASAITAQRGTAPTFYREHFGTDARFYSAANIPAACVGPVGAGLHSDEEWVEIDSLVTLYNVLRTFVTE